MPQVLTICAIYAPGQSTRWTIKIQEIKGL